MHSKCRVIGKYIAYCELDYRRHWLLWELVNGKAEIVRIWTDSKDNVLGAHINKCDRWEILDKDAERAIISVLIGGIEYPVINPKRIYDYGE